MRICGVFLLLVSLAALQSCSTTTSVSPLYEAADRREVDTELWLEAVQSENSEKRLTALRLLGRIGGDQVVDLLLPSLQHERPEIRLEAAFALGISGSVNAIAPLHARLAEESNAEVASAIWLALANLAAPRLQSQLVDAWDHEPEQQQTLAQAAAFLWAYHRDKLQQLDRGLVNRLMQAARSDNVALASNSAAALARVRKEPGAFRRHIVIDTLKSAPVERSRQLLLKVLGTNSDAVGDAFLRDVLAGKVYRDTPPTDAERAEAAAALASRLDDKALTAFIQAMKDEPSWSVRALAFQSLSAEQVEKQRAELQAHIEALPADRAVLEPILQPIVFRDETEEPAKATADYQHVRDAVGMQIRLSTSRGEIDIELLSDAPYTAANFLELVRKGYYNGTVFHRVIPNFVAQGGDPTGRGDGGPGYRIREELSRLPHDKGYIGMATAGKDTAGSQFFFNTERNPHLDWHYTVFAKVMRGEDIMMALQQGDTIVSAKVLEKR